MIDKLTTGIEAERQSSRTKQFATFYLNDMLYGIDVIYVQEVTKALPMTMIRLAPSYVKGLINLRGQIATAIALREVFGLGIGDTNILECMSVVCRNDGNLLSLLVDKIGDVIEVSEASFEDTPDTIEQGVSKFMKGVYKIEGMILSVVGIDNVTSEITKHVKLK